MSSYYKTNYYRRKRKSRQDRDAVFIICGLIGLVVWSNRYNLSRVQYYILIAIVVFGVAFLAYCSRRLVHVLSRLKLQRIINVSGVDHMDGLEFEKFVARLLEKQGYKHIRLTEKFDYGVDIVAEKDGSKWGIQVKRNTGLVKAIAVRQVVTALNHYHCTKSMVITNSKFSRVAKDLATTNRCVLIDRAILAAWIDK